MAWIVANQVGRRNLTPSQKGPLGIELEKQLAIEAKKRRGARRDLREIFPPSDYGKAKDKAAELLGIDPHYVTDAKKIEQDASELREQVKQRTLNIPAGSSRIREKQG